MYCVGPCSLLAAAKPAYARAMTKKPSPTSTEALPVNECWALLRSVSFGRVAVWDVDHPNIFPINFTVDHGTLVFRTGEGTKLAAVRRGHPVAVEADGVDPDTGLAWSVVVKGSAEPMTSTDSLLDSFSLKLFPWHPGRKDTFVRISPTSTTGRRFHVTPPAEWWTAYANARQTYPE